MILVIGLLGAGLGMVGRGYFAPIETHASYYFPDGTLFRGVVRVQGNFKNCEYIVIGSGVPHHTYSTGRRGVSPRETGISYHPGQFYYNGEKVDLPAGRTAVFFFRDDCLYTIQLSADEEQAVRRLDFPAFSRSPAYKSIKLFRDPRSNKLGRNQMELRNLPRQISPAKFVED